MPPIPPSPIKLAILDDYQNLSASHFDSLKPTIETTIFNTTLPSFSHPATTTTQKNELITRLAPFPVIASMRERTPFPEALLSQLPNLKLLLTTGRRNASIDMSAARKLGIHVTGTGTGAPSKRGPDSTTQHCVALILALARNLAVDDAVVKAGGWQTNVAMGLSGKTFAAVGFGRLGVAVAKIMYQSFGMRVLCWSASLTQEKADEAARGAGLEVEDGEGKIFRVVGKQEVFREADVLSVHYVLSERSRGIVSAADLKLLQSTALFVNTSRGPIVDDDALFEMVKEGRIRGAALDVFEREPLEGDSRWRTGEFGGRLLLSPHMGYVEEETMAGWYREQVAIVGRWVRGEDLGDVLLN